MYTSSKENYSSSVRDPPSRWGGKDDKGYVYKKSSYQYSSNGSNNNNNNTSYQNKSAAENIDQLDALLEDLKHERQVTTRERDLLPTSTYRTIERDPSGGKVTKTTRVVKTSKQLGPHQLCDDVETFSTSDYSTMKSANYSSFQDSLKRDEYLTKDRQYGTLAQSPVGGHYESKTYESKRTLNNAELLPTGNTISTTTRTTSDANIGKDLQDIALGDDILPIPGTKVTTTVRTYTYEIPADGTTNTINRNQRLTNNNNVAYKSIREQHETNSTTSNYPPQSRPTVPQTVVYNTESYSTLNKNERPVVSNQSYEIREHKETNTIHNTSGGGSPYPRDVPVGPGHPSSGPGTNRTVVYNIHKTNNIHTTVDEPNRYPPHSPAHSPNTSAPLHAGPHSPPLHNLPPGGTTNRYFYKETSNVVNTIHGPGPNEPGPIAPQKHLPVTYPPPSSPQGNGYPPTHADGYPPNNTTYYKYSSSTTNNRQCPGPDYGTPSPFPVDGVEYPVGNGNPPQRVDELMQSFKNSDAVDRVDIESPRKREIETAVASPNQQHVPSVNRAGKEIYYPPGHETVMTKREEMSAGSAAGGRWAKGSGMYEYESGSRSKTKSKSGGAMVPVCLPLCCAMPCSIM